MAIERPDGHVVDALLAAELAVIVIAPNQVKNLRSRYGSAGNNDDGFDAYVLADTVRTDRHRLRPLTGDSEATTTLRMTVRAARTWSPPQWRWPTSCAPTRRPPAGAIGLFRDIDSVITPRFLTRFPSQDKADRLSRIRSGNWLRSVSYNHRANLDQPWDHLHHAPRGATSPQAAARAQITLAPIAA